MVPTVLCVISVSINNRFKMNEQQLKCGNINGIFQMHCLHIVLRVNKIKPHYLMDNWSNVTLTLILLIIID